MDGANEVGSGGVPGLDLTETWSGRMPAQGNLDPQLSNEVAVNAEDQDYRNHWANVP